MIHRIGSTPQLTEQDLLHDAEVPNGEGRGQPRMVSGFEPVKRAAEEASFDDDAESGARRIPRLVYPGLADKDDAASSFVALLEFPTEEVEKSAVPASSSKAVEPTRRSRPLWVSLVLAGSAALGAMLGVAYRSAQQSSASEHSTVAEIQLPVITVSQPLPRAAQVETPVEVVQPVAPSSAPEQVPEVKSTDSNMDTAPVAETRRWRPLREEEVATRQAVVPVTAVAVEASKPVAESGAAAAAEVAVEEPAIAQVQLPETLSREVVRAGFEALRPALTACANGKSGVAEVAATVATSGRVTHAVINGDFAGTVGSCMARAIRTARFEPFSNGPLMVEFPYAL